MSGGSGRVLLIEDNRAQARLIREQLSDVKTDSFEMDLADRLSEGLSQLENGDFAGVLLDLSLPDSQGLETLNAVRAKAPDVAVVVLTGLNDEALGAEAVKRGAQDYLVKDAADGELIARSLSYAIGRQRLLRNWKAPGSPSWASRIDSTDSWRIGTGNWRSSPTSPAMTCKSRCGS